MSIGTQADNAGEAFSSPIIFRLDRRSGVPTFMQITQQVEQGLRLGYLRKGDQLPRIKDVVGSLLINPNTVQKAYRYLEQKGIARGRPGQGTFIEASPDTVDFKDLATLQRHLRDGWLQEAIATGLDHEAIRALFLSTLREVPDATRGDGDLVGEEFIA